MLHSVFASGQCSAMVKCLQWMKSLLLPARKEAKDGNKNQVNAGKNSKMKNELLQFLVEKRGVEKLMCWTASAATTLNNHTVIIDELVKFQQELMSKADFLADKQQKIKRNVNYVKVIRAAAKAKNARIVLLLLKLSTSNQLVQHSLISRAKQDKDHRLQL